MPRSSGCSARAVTPTCAELRGWLLACALLLGLPASAATPVQTPYVAVSLPFTLHLGPAHAPGDSIMLVRDYGVLFGGDVLYGGRIPFLDSPETDITRWLVGLEYIAGLEDQVRYIIPGHGTLSANARQVVEATRDYILYVREAMARAVRDFVPFDEAYRNTDWSRYEKLPAFDASNRGNAFRIYLEEEARSLK